MVLAVGYSMKFLLILSFMELIIHAITMEFFESHSTNVRSSSAGFDFTPLMQPSLPQPRMTIRTEVDHWRKFLPLNLWEVICREAEEKSGEGMVAIVEADRIFSNEAPEFAKSPSLALVKAFLYIYFDYFSSNTMKVQQERNKG